MMQHLETIQFELQLANITLIQKNLLKQIIIKQRILRLIHYSKKQKINRVVVKQHIMEKAFLLVI